MCAIPGGGFYVSWLNFGNGYSLYLQRLDADGNEMWERNGKLICRRDIYSVVPYGLSVDPDGNAILGIDAGFSELHAPGGKALAFKVSPDGELLWGTTGIALSAAGEPVCFVNCCAMEDSGAAFFWGTANYDSLHVTRLDAAGQQRWTTRVERATTEETISPAAIVAAENGSVIYTFVQHISRSSGDYNSVFAQKLAGADGANLWGSTPVTIVDSSLATAVTLPMGGVPTVMPERAGGAVFGYALTDRQERVYVQRVAANGQLSYVANGLCVSGTQAEAASACFGLDADSGRVYVAWTASYTDPASREDMTSVRAQCIDNAGALLWDQAGVELAPFVPLSEMKPAAMLPVAQGVMAAWIQPPEAAWLPQPLRVCLLDLGGQPVWQNAVVDIKSSTTNTTTDNVAGAIGEAVAGRYGAFTWTSDDYTVRAQNINLDGALGVAT
jgi:hypothetical protein